MSDGVTVQQDNSTVTIIADPAVTIVGGQVGPRGASGDVGDLEIAVDPTALFEAAYTAAKL